MNLFIDYPRAKELGSGKGKFLMRLKPELEKLGVKVQFEPKGADITMGLSKWRTPTSGPRVLRVDGVHLMKDETYKRRKWVNAQIAKAIKQADGVIFQSEFARRMVCELLKAKPRRSWVIFNGADPKDYEVSPMKSDYPWNVIMSARWKNRPQKRLKTMARIATEYARDHKGVCFWVAGKYDKAYWEGPQLRYLGHLEEQTLRRYLKMADVMLNLPRYDWCPNAVVEALVSGTPVICNNGSGTAELIGDNGGIICNIEPPIKARMAKHIPDIDSAAPVHQALDMLLGAPYIATAEHLHIDNIARQYVAAFQEVLGK